VHRFAGYELDPRRGELRGPDGKAVRLRPKAFDMLLVFASNPERVLSKQELIKAVWPGVHAGDDSLFQCIREIRAALGDERRGLVKLVSGRGYRFDATVTSEPPSPERAPEPATPAIARAESDDKATLAERPVEPIEAGRLRLPPRHPAVVAVLVALAAVIGLAAAAPVLRPALLFRQETPTVAVTLVGVGGDRQIRDMAAAVSERLTGGLAKVDGIRVIAPRGDVGSGSPAAVSTRPAAADFIVSGELQKGAGRWEMQARLTEAATGEVRWAGSLSIGAEGGDVLLEQTRLAAGIGHPLALRLNALANFDGQARGGARTSSAEVVIEQAIAFISQTTPERFQAAETMLENARATEPDNVDLEVALAAHQLRGVQLAWYDPATTKQKEASGKAMLLAALRAKPAYVPALEGYCRYLAATNHFVESLVACAKALTFDPWDGTVLFELGMAQVQLGRFEEALASFEQADQFDVPQVSRFTWLLGAGWTYMLMGRDAEALPWLERSIAITPGTGRSYVLLAVAYQHLGRPDAAKAALAKFLQMKPGATAANIALPPANDSPVFLSAGRRILETAMEIGLPVR
jgi:DNA-binding winged helix-turn-helix (wHTH) protein/tetratricopeptide (TPR) repeat protein